MKICRRSRVNDVLFFPVESAMSTRVLSPRSHKVYDGDKLLNTLSEVIKIIMYPRALNIKNDESKEIRRAR